MTINGGLIVTPKDNTMLGRMLKVSLDGAATYPYLLLVVK